MEASLKEYLQSYVKRRDRSEDRTTRYIDAFIDLNADGVPEAIVYLPGGVGGVAEDATRSYSLRMALLSTSSQISQSAARRSAY